MPSAAPDERLIQNQLLMLNSQLGSNCPIEALGLEEFFTRKPYDNIPALRANLGPRAEELKSQIDNLRVHGAFSGDPSDQDLTVKDLKAQIDSHKDEVEKWCVAGEKIATLGRSPRIDDPAIRDAITEARQSLEQVLSEEILGRAKASAEQRINQVSEEVALLRPSTRTADTSELASQLEGIAQKGPPHGSFDRAVQEGLLRVTEGQNLTEEQAEINYDKLRTRWLDVQNLFRTYDGMGDAEKGSLNQEHVVAMFEYAKALSSAIVLTSEQYALAFLGRNNDAVQKFGFQLKQRIGAEVEQRQASYSHGVAQVNENSHMQIPDPAVAEALADEMRDGVDKAGNESAQFFTTAKNHYTKAAADEIENIRLFDMNNPAHREAFAAEEFRKDFDKESQTNDIWRGMRAKEVDQFAVFNQKKELMKQRGMPQALDRKAKEVFDNYFAALKTGTIHKGIRALGMIGTGVVLFSAFTGTLATATVAIPTIPFAVPVVGLIAGATAAFNLLSAFTPLQLLWGKTKYKPGPTIRRFSTGGISAGTGLFVGGVLGLVAKYSFLKTAHDVLREPIKQAMLAGESTTTGSMAAIARTMAINEPFSWVVLAAVTFGTMATFATIRRARAKNRLKHFKPIAGTQDGSNIIQFGRAIPESATT